MPKLRGVSKSSTSAGSAIRPAFKASASPSSRNVCRHRVHHIEVDDDARGQVEGPNQVLPFQVDAGLASDRGVDRTEHRCRHHDRFDTSQPGGGNEAGHVGRGPTAHSDDGVVPAERNLGQPAVRLLDRRHGLGLVSIRDVHHRRRPDRVEDSSGDRSRPRAGQKIAAVLR